MGAPVNVKLERPTTCVVDWEAQARVWRDLNESVNGNPDFYPLTVKAAYILGIIYALCKSVDCLFAPGRLEHTYLPAYGIFASGVELLGRCINGNTRATGSVRDLKTGFMWLKTPDFSNVEESEVLITTGTRAYDIETLVAPTALLRSRSGGIKGGPRRMPPHPKCRLRDTGQDAAIVVRLDWRDIGVHSKEKNAYATISPRQMYSRCAAGRSKRCGYCSRSH